MIGFSRAGGKLWGHKFRGEVLRWLIVNVMLRNIGIGAIGIFMPVFFFRMGGIGLAALYIVMTCGIQAILGQKITQIIGKIGFRWAVLVASFLLICILWLFQMAEATKAWEYVMIAGILAPFETLLYWVSYHLLFLETNEKEYGKNSSVVGVVGTWSLVAGPLLGGALVAAMGYGTLFVWGMVAVAFSTVPVLLMPHEKLNWNFEWGDYLTRLSNGWLGKDFWIYVGWGMEGIMLEFWWPIFLVLKLGGSDLLLGGFKTLVLLISSATLLVVGRWYDRGFASKCCEWAVWIMGVVWILRGIVGNGWGLLSLDAVDAVAGILWFFPLGLYGLWRARSGNKTLYMVERETALNVGRVVASLGVVTMYTLGASWEQVSLIGIAGILMTRGWGGDRV